MKHEYHENKEKSNYDEAMEKVLAKKDDGISTVELLSYWTMGRPDGDAAIALKARISYDRTHGTPEKDRQLVRRLVWEGHGTPLEAVSFAFRITTPIFVARQLMRYRMASFNEMSRRYVKKPIQNLSAEQINEMLKRRDINNNNAVEKLVEFFKKSEELYDELLKETWDREIARLVQPVSSYTSFIVVLNLRELLHIYEQRWSAHAQIETRMVAKMMVDLAYPYAPVAIETFKRKLVKSYAGEKGAMLDVVIHNSSDFEQDNYTCSKCVYNLFCKYKFDEKNKYGYCIVADENKK